MSDERAGAIEAVALWLAGEDGDLEDFPTNAGQARDYQMDRARNIVAVVAPHMAGNGEAERLRKALSELVRLKDHPDHDNIDPIVKGEAWDAARAALHAAQPDAERHQQEER